MIVANDVTQEGAGFDTDTNIVTIFSRDGREIPLPKLTQIRSCQPHPRPRPRNASRANPLLPIPPPHPPLIPLPPPLVFLSPR